MDSFFGLVLDSSVVIAAERNRQPVAELAKAIRVAHKSSHLLLSPVTVVELIHGVYRASTPERGFRRGAYVNELLRLVPIHPATGQTARIAGEIEGREASKGNVLPFRDLMIGATAIETGCAVLTINLRDFSRIPGLKVIAF